MAHLEHALLVCLGIFFSCWLFGHYVWPVPALEARPAGGMQLSAANVQVPAAYRFGTFASRRQLSVPKGTRVELFRHGLRGVGRLAISPAGQLFVSLPRSGEVIKLVDDDQDGYAEKLYSVAAGLDAPYGLSFDRSDLVVAGRTSLYRLPEAAQKPVPEVQLLDQSDAGDNPTCLRAIATGPQRSIYVSAGASCGVGKGESARCGSVRVFAPTGGEGELFAEGFNAPLGLAFHPGTGTLWGTDIGSGTGRESDPDEINLLRAGGDYGWSGCDGARLPESRFDQSFRAAESTPAAQSLPAGCFPRDLVFTSGLGAGDALLVACYGSAERPSASGFKVLLTAFANGGAGGEIVELVGGWFVNGEAWGRPAALALGTDKALFVGDDSAGAIYRIVFNSLHKE